MITIVKTYSNESILAAKKRIFENFFMHVGALGYEEDLDILEAVINHYIAQNKEYKDGK